MAKKVGTLNLNRLHTEEDFGFMKLAHGETANLPIVIPHPDAGYHTPPWLSKKCTECSVVLLKSTGRLIFGG